MSVITLRISSPLLQEIDDIAKEKHLGRAQYIRLAIERMNEEALKHARVAQLKAASLRVRKNSQDVNDAFSEIEHDPDA